MLQIMWPRPAWLSIAAAEAWLIARNRTVAVSATIVPLALGGLVVYRGVPSAGVADGVAIQVIMMMAFTVYMTGTMTLSARRGQLYLRRLRSTHASTFDIIVGLCLIPMVLCFIQIAMIAAIIGYSANSAPSHPVLLIPALALSGAMCVALAFLTAAFTRSPEAAQVTTVPVFGMLMGGAFWTMMTPAAEVNWQMLAVPGGAIFQLVRVAWEGAASASFEGLVPLWETLGLPIVMSIVHVVLACLIAARCFSWQPRD